jgi:serine/arginine repetitive matrix protein 2
VSRTRPTLLTPSHSLSRRFSLLRSATGESVPVEQLKTRLANHRKQGSENQISEEEEDMLLETLNRLRSRVSSTPSTEGSQEQLAPTQDSAQDSTLSSSITSTSSRSTKRYSNQLFGSGRLRDYKGSPSKASRTSARTISVTSTDSQAQETQDSSSRPVTPYTDGPVSSAQSSSLADVALPTRSDSLSPYDVEEDDHHQSISVAEYRLNMALGPNVFKRASLAIQQAIKEIEDEVEEEILLPRSTPIPRGSIDQHIHSPEVV